MKKILLTILFACPALFAKNVQYGDMIALGSPHKNGYLEMNRNYFYCDKEVYDVDFGRDRAQVVWKIGSPVKNMFGDVHYGHKVTLKNENGFLGSENDQKFWVLSNDRQQAGAWEEWELVNPDNPKFKGPVAYGAPVALKSAFNRYLTAEDDKKNANANRQELSGWQRWTIG